jgi:hypothetical protein
MPLTAKPAGAGLVTVPSIRVDGRDEPVLRHASGDPKHPILPLVKVLAGTAANNAAAFSSSGPAAGHPRPKRGMCPTRGHHKSRSSS